MDELIELEQRIKHKIAQTKDKMHKTQERAITDRLWPEIETLNWVLNEILVFRQKEAGFFSNAWNLPEHEFVNFYFPRAVDFFGLVWLEKKKKLLPISLENYYKFLVLLPLEADEKMEALKHYFGITQSNEIIARGIEAKIIHKGRGKFKILEDNCKGKYIGKIVDASDVIRCKL